MILSLASPSVKIQIMGGKVCLRCKGKILLGIVHKLLKTKSLLTSPRNTEENEEHFSFDQSRFLETPLIWQADGKLKNLAPLESL